jgi:SsrA-binding protein
MNSKPTAPSRPPKKNKSKSGDNPTVAVNRKARFEYHIEDNFEAGMVLQGWELKSIRAGSASIIDSYVIIKRGEAWLVGAQFTPLSSASTHIVATPMRTRKLLLHAKEISKLQGQVERTGYTLIPLKLYWVNNRVKLEFGLAKGKKEFDKRETIKNREWERDKQRLNKLIR